MANSYGRNRTVFKWALAAAVGGMAVQTFGYFVRSRENAQISYTDHYRKGIALTKANDGIEYLFGKPIEIGVRKNRLDAANKRQYCQGCFSNITIFLTFFKIA